MKKASIFLLVLATAQVSYGMKAQAADEGKKKKVSDKVVLITPKDWAQFLLAKSSHANVGASSTPATSPANSSIDASDFDGWSEAMDEAPTASGVRPSNATRMPDVPFSYPHDGPLDNDHHQKD